MTIAPDVSHSGQPVRRELRRIPAAAVHLPEDPGYETGRLPWNLMFDPKPAVVVEAATPREAQAAIRAAQECALPLAVQSTGHGIVVPADGGMLLTTSRMDSVVVDPQRRTVRVGGGAQWGAVMSAAAKYGLAPLAGPPMVGVTGYTLGGGAGWLSRRHGFAADSLRRAEVVTAAGELVTASAEEHPDLLWALRGGSGNFGLVTSLELELYPVERAGAWRSMHSFDRAAHVLACYRDWAPTQPDQLNSAVVLAWMPDDPELPEPMRGKPVVTIRAFCVDGHGESDARRLLAPLLAAAGPPLLEGHYEEPYPLAAERITGLLQPPAAIEQDVVLFREPSDDVFEVMTKAIGDRTASPLALELRYWGGAMARPAPGAGPVGHRDVPFSVLMWTVLEQPSNAGEVAEAAARLRPFATDFSFLNFIGDPARTRSAFTADHYQRLVQVKRRYDPTNVFRLNHNIPPDTGRT